MYTEDFMVTIPEGVKIEVAEQLLVVRGAQGEVRKIVPATIRVSVNGSKVDVCGQDNALVNTVIAHIKNMFKGVKEGFTVKVKIVYAHFPITLEVKGKEAIVKNFLGEKLPRKAKIVGSTKIEVNGQDVTIFGVDKEAVGATLSNLKMATKIRKKDSRVFQDGLYVVE